MRMASIDPKSKVPTGTHRSKWMGPRHGKRRKAWEEVRKRVLARDRYECQIRLPTICTGVANTVDHIRPLAEGGHELDERNLRGACHSCNSYLGAKLGGQRLAQKMNRHSRAW